MKPIIFNSEEVKAILDGRKNQVRIPIKSPYQVGDILYVRHDFWKNGMSIWDEYNRMIRFENGQEINDCGIDKDFVGWKHCPSTNMPKWAARIFLKVTGVRVEKEEKGTEKICLTISE